MKAPAASACLTVGLTGGIGSGKSTAARTLTACGALVIDTDAIARALTASDGAAMSAIVEAFGPALRNADGALDRDRMRRLAFGDAGARARLEAILHPLIAAEAQRRATQAAGCRPVVFEVPLLVESGHWRARVDRVLVIDCLESTQIARTLQRPGWTENTARAVLALQATRAQRRAAADAVICNEGLSLEEFERAVRDLWSSWMPGPAPA